MKLAGAVLFVFASSAAWADSQITMNMVDENGIGANIGTVAAADSKFGLVLTPSLKNLAPGLHGFHVHQNPNCGPGKADGKPGAALAAGGHLDPAGANKHGTPWGDGHLGDLPPLYVDASGNASQPLLAPRLKVADLAGRSLVIHAGADNHADHPAALGGGGARVACGVVK